MANYKEACITAVNNLKNKDKIVIVSNSKAFSRLQIALLISLLSDIVLVKEVEKLLQKCISL